MSDCRRRDCVSFRTRSCLDRGARPTRSASAASAQRVLLACALIFLLMPWLADAAEGRATPCRSCRRSSPSCCSSRKAGATAVRRRSKQEKACRAPKHKQNPSRSVPRDRRSRKLTKGAGARGAQARVPDKPPGEKIERRGARASGVGLLAMKDELAEIRGAPVGGAAEAGHQAGPGRWHQRRRRRRRRQRGRHSRCAH